MALKLRIRVGGGGLLGLVDDECFHYRVETCKTFRMQFSKCFQCHFNNSSSATFCFSPLTLQSPSILSLRALRLFGEDLELCLTKSQLRTFLTTSWTFVDKRKPVSFFEGESSNSLNTQFRRLFGRQKPVHHLLGGGKSADVLLWRDKKISAGVLTSATSIWVLFEWLNYHLLKILCFAVVLVMVVQFIWSNVSGYSSSVPSEVPRLVLPEDFFINIATTAGAEINRGFVAAHTLPVLYERHEDEVDNFVYKVLDEMQNRFQSPNAGLLSRISKAKLKGKKHD